MNIFKFTSLSELNLKVLNVLKEQSDNNYLLMLSGGRSPFDLYKFLSQVEDFKFPNEIAQIDERAGDEPNYKQSNLKMISESGFLLKAVEKIGTESIHTILSRDMPPYESAVAYNDKLEMLKQKYKNRIIGIMGMGTDGHTAGVLSNSPAVFAHSNAFFYESADEYKRRVTVTLEFIKNNINIPILLLIGKEKVENFERIINVEVDVNKFPVLIYKEIPGAIILCISQ